jgi:putative NIF3 family GTP cyclohydrolase 1 type 2
VSSADQGTAVDIGADMIIAYHPLSWPGMSDVRSAGGSGRVGTVSDLATDTWASHVPYILTAKEQRL